MTFKEYSSSSIVFVPPLCSSVPISIIISLLCLDAVSIQKMYSSFSLAKISSVCRFPDGSMLGSIWIILKSLKVFAGTGEPQRAEMTLDVFGEVKKASETGDGPVDAIFKCVKKLYPHDVNLQLYQVHAVTEGTDAQATVSVRIEENGKTTVGQAADTDTLVASANAYINALNKMIIKRDKTAPGYSPELKKEEKVRGI